jgi:hypothetical protein
LLLGLVVLPAGSGQSSTSGIVRTMTLGSGSSNLVITPAATTLHPAVSATAAEALINKQMTAAPWSDARRLQFGLALATTNSTDLGDLVDRLAWVAVYSVPGRDIPPASTPARTPACAWPTDLRVEISALVDARSGQAGVWNQVTCCRNLN